MYQVLYIVQFIYCESSLFSLNCYFESYKVLNSNSYYKSKYSLLHYLSKSYYGRKRFLSLSCFNIMPMIFVKFEVVLTIHIWVSFSTLFIFEIAKLLVKHRFSNFVFFCYKINYFHVYYQGNPITFYCLVLLP